MNPSGRVLAFGPFEVDLTTHELRKFGTRVRIPEQSFKLLAVLLESPGELISRETLRSRLWSPDTYVDFDRSLTVAINRLRAALSDSADKPRYIETLPRLGYRFIAPVEVVSNGSKAAGEAAAAPETGAAEVKPLRPATESLLPPTAPEPLFSLPSWALSLAVLVAVIATSLVAIGLASGRWHLRSSKTRPIDSIAVLPFANAAGDANADAEYLSDGITEALTTNLVRVPGLKVKSRNSVFDYKGKAVDLRKVAKDLGVSALVGGRVVPRGDMLEVSAELIDARDNTEIWGQHYSYRSAEIIALQQRIASEIAQKIRSTLSPSEQQRVTKQATQSPDAYEAYLKGRYYWNKRTIVDLERAIGYFNQAIAADPGYAMAYSGLADCYSVMATYGGNPKETYAQATAAAFRALELDPTLARPHAVLGSAEMEYDWDYASGEAEYKKAIALDPDDATAHHWYAQDIGWLGKSDEALAQVNIAHQLEPTSLMVTTMIGMIDITARKFDDAISVCGKVVSDTPAFAQAHDCLALAYWGKRDYPKVIAEWKAVGQVSRDESFTELAAAMERGYRGGNWKRAVREGAAVREAQRKRGYMTAYYIGAFYADMGNKDEAFRWLDIAFQERDVYLISLPTDYLVDSLRDDPRFRELEKKMGLPHSPTPQ